MPTQSLTIIGTGIKSVSHFTVEARAYLTQSDRVLYLVNEENLKEWIQNQNPNAESLDAIYCAQKLRRDNYAAITNYILEVLQTNCHVCVVLYGHPCVFAQPALNAVIKAKALGIDARILPGISAEDCLFSDLCINPGDFGCQSFEATDFLLYKRIWDPTSHLILWQVGFIGMLEKVPVKFDNSKGINALHQLLSQYYEGDHLVVAYEAAQLPHQDPKIESFTLGELTSATLTSLSTLYVAPKNQRQLDGMAAKMLGIDLAGLS